MVSSSAKNIYKKTELRKEMALYYCQELDMQGKYILSQLL